MASSRPKFYFSPEVKVTRLTAIITITWQEKTVIFFVEFNGDVRTKSYIETPPFTFPPLTLILPETTFPQSTVRLNRFALWSTLLILDSGLVQHPTRWTLRARSAPELVVGQLHSTLCDLCTCHTVDKGTNNKPRTCYILITPTARQFNLTHKVTSLFHGVCRGYLASSEFKTQSPYTSYSQNLTFTHR